MNFSFAHLFPGLCAGLLMLSLASDQALAAEWVVLRLPGLQDEHAFDLATVYLFGDEVTFWHRVRPAVTATGSSSLRLLRERIQCSQRTLTTLTELDYDQDGKLLKVNTPWARDPVVIERAEERELALAICRLIGRKGDESATVLRSAGGENND
jgi:hypothetical protein